MFSQRQMLEVILAAIQQAALRGAPQKLIADLAAHGQTVMVGEPVEVEEAWSLAQRAIAEGL